MISLSELIQDERTVPVPVGKDPKDGEEIAITVTYRPSNLTPMVEMDAGKLYAQGMQGSGTAKLLAGIVTDWDIVNDAQEPVPPTYEGMCLVPVYVLSKILNAVLTDVRVSKEESKKLRRWLATKGEIGACPPWYPIIKAARIAGVPAWVLMEQKSAAYTWMYLSSVAAENGAQNVDISHEID